MKKTIAFFVALALACAPAAHAQEKTSRLVVPVPAGGSLDVLARLLAGKLSGAGETWIVDNRPGAESMIGAEHVAQSPADGRTVLVGGVTVVLVPLLRKTPFTPESLRPVVQVSYSNFAIVVPAQSPITSAADLAAAAAGSARGLDCGAPPGPMGVACAQLAHRLGGKVTPIPYAGVAPAVTAVLGGHIDLLVVSADSIVKLVEAGKLRALAVSSPVAGLKAPLMSEVWPGFEMDGFVGLFVPAATPDAEVKRLAAAVNRAQADPAFAAAMRESGNEPSAGTTDQFTARIGRARAFYRDLLPRLGIEPR